MITYEFRDTVALYFGDVLPQQMYFAVTGSKMVTDLEYNLTMEKAAEARSGHTKQKAIKRVLRKRAL
ncbi:MULTISPECIES: hypothetical protein [unclassified Sporolactobacillus]|uniref:hypothetical protein n=1 Tax=unclassified Sporolactobacillus TaxID=2628533 RepID=UPI00236763D6|nr:hypothetical protein [Sporolactobacillus sp. CQH2019]MDD9147792.1 hypothetical protein [Sporolactobacillus sp. CQH2019]